MIAFKIAALKCSSNLKTLRPQFMHGSPYEVGTIFANADDTQKIAQKLPNIEDLGRYLMFEHFPIRTPSCHEMYVLMYAILLEVKYNRPCKVKHFECHVQDVAAGGEDEFVKDILNRVKQELINLNIVDENFNMNKLNMTTRIGEYLQWFQNLQSIELVKGYERPRSDPHEVLYDYLEKVKPKHLRKITTDSINHLARLNKAVRTLGTVQSVVMNIYGKYSEHYHQLEPCDAITHIHVEQEVVDDKWLTILAKNHNLWLNWTHLEVSNGSQTDMSDNLNLIELLNRKTNFTHVTIRYEISVFHQTLIKSLLNNKKLTDIHIRFSFFENTEDSLTYELLIKLLSMKELRKVLIHFTLSKRKSESVINEEFHEIIKKVLKYQFDDGRKFKFNDVSVKTHPYSKYELELVQIGKKAPYENVN